MAAAQPPYGGDHPGINRATLLEARKRTRFGRKRQLRETLLDRSTRYGKEWAAVLQSDLAYEEGHDNENWIPMRPLGEGSFGTVSLWTKKNELSEPLESLAMKEMDPEDEDATGYWAQHIAREAFIQSKLTCQAPHSVVNLKNYRFYEHERKCRLYMEYAELGSLEDIRRWYRAWDTYLPEEFVWLVFHELALAAQAMERCPKVWQPFSDQPHDQPNAANYILHMDLKAANVFLCKRQRREPANTFPSTYPQVKVGDFGLSVVTGPNDADNPVALRLFGDDDCKTPEQRRFGRLWGWNPPFNGGYGAAQGFRFTAPQNIWQVVLIVHDLMTTSKVGEVEDQMKRHADAVAAPGILAYRQPLPNPNPAAPNVPRNHFMDLPTSYNRTEYSQRLREVVWRCLKPGINARPTAAQLVNLTQAGVQNAILARQNATPGGQGRVQQVAVTKAQMNTKPHGQNALRSRMVDVRDPDEGIEWADMRDKFYQDPDEPQLQPPQGKWRRFYLNEGVNRDVNDVWKSWRRVDGIVHPHDPDANPQRRPKRVRSFDGRDMRDLEFGGLLDTMKPLVSPLMNRKPMAIVEYVLQKEKMDTDVANEILQWMYQPGIQTRQVWRWAHKQENQDRAAQVVLRGQGSWAYRECLYFVASNSAAGVEQVDAAVDALNGVYGTM